MTSHYFYSAPSIKDLSPRQIEVACAFSRGLSHKQIAVALKISPSTVRNHISMIYRILGVRNKAELVMLFAEDMHQPVVGPESYCLLLAPS